MFLFYISILSNARYVPLELLGHFKLPFYLMRVPPRTTEHTDPGRNSFFHLIDQLTFSIIYLSVRFPNRFFYVPIAFFSGGGFVFPVVGFAALGCLAPT